jgi:hypothetical protein
LKGGYSNNPPCGAQKNKANFGAEPELGCLNIGDKAGNLLSQAQRRSWAYSHKENSGLEKRS